LIHRKENREKALFFLVLVVVSNEILRAPFFTQTAKKYTHMNLKMDPGADNFRSAGLFIFYLNLKKKI
jgi:hypothetical protein